MNLLGFQITRRPRTSRSSTPPPVTRSLSPSALAWLYDTPASSTPLLSNAYQQVVWVYRAVNVLAEQVANIPFLFSAGERGRENLITSGPLHTFYNRPHPHINRFQYWELRVIWLMLRGECFRVPIYEDRSGHLSHSPLSSRSTLKKILILDPANFQHILDGHDLVGWRFTGAPRQTPIASQVLLPNEVYFEKLPNPFDFWRGMAPLHVAALAAQTDFAASAFMKGFLENNADLGTIVQTEQPLTEDQQEQLLAALKNRKRNAGTANAPVVLWNGAEIVRPELSSSDLQFLENRNFSRSEICTAFGIPQEIVTITGNSKYDVMEGARLNFIENRVAPLCSRLEAEEQPLIQSIDPNATGWFDLDTLPIMQAARRARLSAAKTGFDMGVPFNELNRVLDLGFQPLPWGDTGYLPAKLQKAGQTTPTPSPSEPSNQKSTTHDNPFAKLLTLTQKNPSLLRTPPNH